MTLSDWCDEFAAQSARARKLRRPFDRVALHDSRPLAGVPALEAAEARTLHGLPESLLGVPIVIDPKVEVGVIELRDGVRVVERILIAELRA